MESTRDSKSYLREVKGSVKTLRSGGKKEGGRQEEMGQFQPAVDHGDLDGEKGPTGKWRERNDRKTDTL